MPANMNHFAYTKGETTILLYGHGPVNSTRQPVGRSADENGYDEFMNDLRLMVFRLSRRRVVGTWGRWQSMRPRVATYLVTATRGERGRFGDESPGRKSSAGARGELFAAAKELGPRDVALAIRRRADSVAAPEAIENIAGHICRVAAGRHVRS